MLFLSRMAGRVTRFLRLGPTEGALEITETPVGRFLTCDNDLVLATIRKTGYWDKHLLAIFEANTDKESIVIDIGAHCGFYSIFLAKRVRKVYSIEPQPYIFSILERNISLNNCENVQALNIAAYDSTTTLSIAPENEQVVPVPTKDGKVDYGRLPNSAGLALSPSPGEIRGERMDDVIPESETVSFIKCDAQGADLRALKGSTSIIQRCRPTILFEFERMLAKIYGDTWGDYEAYFEQMGYELESVHNPVFQLGKQPYKEYLCKPI